MDAQENNKRESKEIVLLKCNNWTYCTICVLLFAGAAKRLSLGTGVQLLSGCALCSLQVFASAFVFAFVCLTVCPVQSPAKSASATGSPCQCVGTLQYVDSSIFKNIFFCKLFQAAWTWTGGRI